MADVKDVASFFIEIANKNDEDFMTNLRLNKLLYFAQAWSLALLNKPLFEKDIHAWRLGPVIPEIYKEYKRYGSAPITDAVETSRDTFTEEEFTLLLDVAREYGSFTTPALVNKAHVEGGPWHQVYCEHSYNDVIGNDRIKRYFKTQPRLRNFDEIIASDIKVVEGYRDEDGVLVLPAELDDEWGI